MIGSVCFHLQETQYKQPNLIIKIHGNKKITEFLFISGYYFITACQVEKTETIHLKGQLIDMGSTIVSMRYDGAASLLGNSRDILLQTDEEGHFDTIIL